jgi:hypothetical protein
MLYDYQQQLENARAQDAAKKKEARQNLRKLNTGKHKGEAAKTAQEVAALAAAATPWGFFSLILHANIITDWMYGAALFAAMLKDLLDFVGIGSLPAIGTAITFCVSIFIGMMMLLGGFMNNAGGRRQRRQQQAIKSLLVLIGGTSIELLFGLNFMPVESITVLIVYSLMLVERKRALAEEKARNRYMSAQEAYA